MWPNPQETADSVTFTEEILNGKLHFLCRVNSERASQVCLKTPNEMFDSLSVKVAII